MRKKKLKNKSSTYIISILISVLVLIIDQISKAYISTNITLGAEPTSFIKGLINITYIHNTGGAWGMLSGKTWILILVTAIVMLGCIVVLIMNFKKQPLLFWSISLVVSGGIGNLIDRIFRDGKVIDFLHFDFWPSFPVFNIADCAIVIGAALLFYYALFADFIFKKDKNENN